MFKVLKHVYDAYKTLPQFWFGLIYCRVCIPPFCAYCFVVVMFHYSEHKKEWYMKNKQGKLQTAGTTKDALHNSTMSNGGTTSKDTQRVSHKCFLRTHNGGWAQFPRTSRLRKIVHWYLIGKNAHTISIISTRNIYISDAIAITCKGMCLGSELEIQIMNDFYVTKTCSYHN